MTVTDPGVHKIAAGEYHADPCPEPSLSASVAKVLLEKSPRHAHIIHPRLGGAERSELREERFDIGTATHALLLEGADIIHEVEAENWRTKDAQDVRKKARENGLIPLLTKEVRQVREMAAAVREQLLEHDAHPPLFEDGKPEQALVWQEPNGVWCRALVDWLRDDLTAIDDLKTTGVSSNPHDWTRTTMWNIGADVQVAMNLRGIQRLTGRIPEFRFVVVETTPPYALSVVSLAPDALAVAAAKVEQAIGIWKDCLDRDDWPSYSRQVCYAEMPPWTSTRWLEQEAAMEMEAEVTR